MQLRFARTSADKKRRQSVSDGTGSFAKTATAAIIKSRSVRKTEAKMQSPSEVKPLKAEAKEKFKKYALRLDFESIFFYFDRRCRGL